MATVRLRGPLRALAGGSGEHDLDCATVIETLRALEHRHPNLSGWILDESGRVRRHINVFVNGERAAETTAVDPTDRIEVIPAITGG